jgi:hypothetical protein
MSSALPASAAAVEAASGATVAANDDDADGAVVPPSSTEDEGAYVGPLVEFEVACFGAWRSRTALDRWATTRPQLFGPVGQEDHGSPRRFDRRERGDRHE